MSKFTRKPKPGVEDFILGAESPPIPSAAPPSPEPPLPWNEPWVRNDVLKVYNLRLPEPYLLKLKFIAGNTPGSMQKFCLDALLPAIDAKVEQLTKS